MLICNCKSIVPINTTFSTKSFQTSIYATDSITVSEFTTVTTSTQSSTTVRNEETTTVSDHKPYVFQSNFSRNNDSIFVSLYSNSSDTYIAVNNTFIDMQNSSHPCVLSFSERSFHSHEHVVSTIVIDFNGTLTRDLAVQLGDRLIDIIDLLMTVRSMIHENITVH
ncbi:unnamed protein product [Adineta ricciae]|uniref:Uncharacterized protein n=1 Tax=Adineta ricciae TaxID=249248 RepID=A0A814CR12_ADIRI|nr:unnamed protein product [Adineta ricciae]